ncbi:MAG: trypsin, partial [Bacteroidetes bacterium]|nr:trypsin [Bacteroidota bacterium]
ANFFPFGIGTSVNRYIIEGIARAGLGEPLIITNKSEAKEKAEKFRQYIQSPVLTNIAIEFAGFDVYDVEPLSFPDLFAERPIVIFGKWKNKPKGKIKVRGVSGTEKYTKDINLSDYDPTDKNAALRYLWARNRIMTLSDYNELAHNKALVKEITELGLKYNLLTEYTSFVGIDDETLTNNISGQSSGSVPEPHEWALIMLMAMALSWFYFYGFLRS